LAIEQPEFGPLSTRQRVDNYATQIKLITV